ncbi:MAG TPA: DUF488 family protein [Fluviicola sp.]|nr:DUF488 family protein [Fluviicola sp.]
MSENIHIKRIYEKPDLADGYRILIDRLWPRGIRKETASIDEWSKDLAPSSELRKWFNHQDERFEEFQKRYIEELTKKQELILKIIALSRIKPITLLYGAKNKTHNQAVVLLDYLKKFV